jgi:hypothetical protein
MLAVSLMMVSQVPTYSFAHPRAPSQRGPGPAGGRTVCRLPVSIPGSRWELLPISPDPEHQRLGKLTRAADHGS